MTAHKRNYENAISLYESGNSIAQVAAVCGVTRQAMHEALRKRGVAFRKTQLLISVMFQGVKFSPGNYGYWRRTDGDRELMHRFVWRHYNGPIPKDHDVHHKNHNKADNRIENLELKTKADHTQAHHLQPVSLRDCLECGQTIERHPHEGPTAYRRRVFCGYRCSRAWLKGKPRGTKAKCGI